MLVSYYFGFRKLVKIVTVVGGNILSSPCLSRVTLFREVFGKVLEGEDIAKNVEAVGTNSGQPKKTVTIADSGELK